jgi:hypothetical protein
MCQIISKLSNIFLKVGMFGPFHPGLIYLARMNLTNLSILLINISTGPNGLLFKTGGGKYSSGPEVLYVLK